MKPSSASKNEWIIGGVLGGAALSLPYLLHAEHHGGWWEKIPGWWALFGFAGVFLIVVVSKWLGKVLLQKPEDWYG